MAAAVFNDFSPTIKGITIGNAHVYLWGRLAAPWSVEAAAYIDGVVKSIQVCAPGCGMVGSFPLPDGGIFTWVIIPTGPDAMNWQLTAKPSGGAEILQKGTF